MQSRPDRRRTISGIVGLCAILTAIAACGGARAPSGHSQNASRDFTILTPAAKADAGDVTWATYREVQTLDPIQAFDYPENTVDPLLCDSLLRQGPDQTIKDGLAKLTTPSPSEFDFSINPDAKFWDGSPVTAADAVFSLKRAADPKGGGYYSQFFSRVTSIVATGDKTFKIVLSKPDYWLLGELSAPPGEIVQQKYAEAKGHDFGTVSGGTMCSGPFKLASWQTGKGVKVVPNPNYWDSSLPRPKLTSLTLIGVATDASLTAGLESGAISGAYPLALSTLSQLESNPKVKVYQGPPFASINMIITASKGPLRNPTGRQAVSYAVDRKGLISTVLRGSGSVPHALVAEGAWGYAKDVYSKAYDALPPMNQNLAKAKALAKQAGIAGKTITIGTSSGIPTVNIEALAFKAAAEAVGLKVVMQNVSASNYVNYFVDPKARASIDAVPVTNYGDWAGPDSIYSLFALGDGSLNYSGWTNPEVTKYLEAARSEPDEVKRAEDTVAAQKLITEQLPVIPLIAPNNVLIMNKKITGAPATFSYAFGPWAAYLGGSGSS